jgi:hypothetical protein
MFNSNSGCNLRLHPKVKLFITIQYALMESLVNFEQRNYRISILQNWLSLKNRKIILEVMDWAGPSEQD